MWVNEALRFNEITTLFYSFSRGFAAFISLLNLMEEATAGAAMTNSGMRVYKIVLLGQGGVGKSGEY